jgi:hypothetical protein
MKHRDCEWRLFTYDHESVVDALRRGECDGVVPTSQGLLDGFAEFLHRAGVLLEFETFASRHQPHNAAAFFFCHTVLHQPLFRCPALTGTETNLFRSSSAMRLLGFNARSMRVGFYADDDPTPQNMESVGELFSDTTEEDLFAFQRRWLHAIERAWPRILANRLWVLDCLPFSTATGGPSTDQYKVCVLGLWHDGEVWPLLWRFAEAGRSDLSLGLSVITEAERILGPSAIDSLLVSHRFHDEEWAAELGRRGITVIMKTDSDLEAMARLQSVTELSSSAWSDGPALITDHHQPSRRAITVYSDLQQWATTQAPSRSYHTHHTTADPMSCQTVVVTAAAASHSAAERTKHWDIEEEVFAALAGPWRFDELPPCRPDVARAMVHFSLLAYTLLGIYFAYTHTDHHQWSPSSQSQPEQELAVYAGPFFALLRPSELLAIILKNHEAWLSKKDRLLLVQRLTEGATCSS